MGRVVLLLAVGLLTIPCFTGCGDPSAAARERQPNVLLVVMDTTRGDRCSVNGYERPTTPNLEALGREGVVFRNAWSPSCWTAPAHASMFTGLRPEHHGLNGRTGTHLPPIRITMAERLREAGYATACYTLNNMISEEFGLTQGFEKVEPLYKEPGAYPWAQRAQRYALEWVDRVRRGDRPFLLFLNHMEPHHPYTPSVQYQDRFLTAGTPAELVTRARMLDTPDLNAHNAFIHRIDADVLAAASDLYDAEIAWLDTAVGGLVEGLRQRGILDDTVVIVTADHGENFGDHGLVEHAFSLHRSLRHVPLVIRYPKRFEAGAVVNDVVRLEDLFPTVLELAGIRPEGRQDGKSLLSDLPDRLSRAIFGESSRYLEKVRAGRPETPESIRLRAGIRAVFDGRYHLLSYSDNREELYDVTADPEELNDLSKERPWVADRLRDLLPADSTQ